MAKKNSEEINFQRYVDAAKHKKIHWDYFIDLMQDISFTDVNRLRHLNATLLNELTINYSDMDKFKYLNGILLSEFKNYIQRECETEMIENDDLENLQETNKEKKKEILINSEIEIVPIILHEIKDNLSLSCKEEIPEYDQSQTDDAKIFLCSICDKEYSMNFHLKQHMRKVHEEKKKKISIEKSPFNSDEFGELFSKPDELNDHNNVSDNDQLCDEISSEQSPSKPSNSKTLINTINPINEYSLDLGVGEGHKDYKCKSCGKLFSQAYNLKTHIHAVHEGHKDYNCEFCGTSFSQQGCLKKHIYSIHKGR